MSKFKPLPRWRSRRQLMRWMRQSSNQGFTLPMLIGVGLIVILIGFTILTRSQTDKVASISQRQVSQAFAVAEGGMSRTLGLLNQQSYQGFLRATYNPLNPRGGAYLTTAGLPNDSNNTSVTALISGSGSWASSSVGPCVTGSVSGAIDDIFRPQELPNTGGGVYRVLAYRYVSGENAGYLLVRGDVPVPGSTIPTTPIRNSSTNAIPPTTTTIPETASTAFVLQKVTIADKFLPINFPGLLADHVSIDNMDIFGTDGNVVCRNATLCDVNKYTGTNPPRCEASGQPSRAALEKAMNFKTNGSVQGQLAIANVSMPPLPTAPASGTLNIGNGTGANSADLNLNGGVTTFPNPSAPNAGLVTVDGKTFYAYTVRNIDLKGGAQLRFNTTTHPVYLFVTGNVSMGGTSGIDNFCTGAGCSTGPEFTDKVANANVPRNPREFLGNADRLRLYGRADAGGAPDTSGNQKISVKGTSDVASMFIYAPDADVGFAGNTTMSGAIWSKSFGVDTQVSSNSASVEMRVPDGLAAALSADGLNASITLARTTEAINWGRLAKF